MIIAVFSQKDLDCIRRGGREYYLFDTGMATAFMILRAMGLGLVAHPIAGFNRIVSEDAPPSATYNRRNASKAFITSVVVKALPVVVNAVVVTACFPCAFVANQVQCGL
jgi:hypothetical protein